ncbi:MAG: hypothetical protein ACRENJ_02070 [Candidatus Eiseniibacteriota bacterium]
MGFRTITETITAARVETRIIGAHCDLCGHAIAWETEPYYDVAVNLSRGKLGAMHLRLLVCLRCGDGPHVSPLIFGQRLAEIDRAMNQRQP